MSFISEEMSTDKRRLKYQARSIFHLVGFILNLKKSNLQIQVQDNSENFDQI